MGGDHYETLGISPKAPPEVVQAAYRALSKRFHPDSGVEPNQRRMQQINEAWGVLRDPSARARYDAHLARTQRSPEGGTDAEQPLGDEGWGDEPDPQVAGGPGPGPAPAPAPRPEPGTEEAADQADPTAVIWRRFAAYLVDYGVAWTLSWPLWLAVYFATSSDGAVLDAALDYGGLVMVVVIHGVLQGLRGVTPGKRLLGLRTIRHDGQVPGLGRAFVRTLFLVFVDNLPVFVGLPPFTPVVGGVTAVFTRGHRRVGDLVAGTYVVRGAQAGTPLTPADSAWAQWRRSRRVRGA